MKVVTAETMQQVDRSAIEGRGIPGLALMENAGRGCAEAIIEAFGASGTAAIVAGKGNNGGDGYVIARLLREKGWQVAVFVLARKEQITGDALVNLERLTATSQPPFPAPQSIPGPENMVFFCPQEGMLEQHASSWQSATVLVDALFGTGLKSDVAGIYADAVGRINAAGRPVVAVDIPSGINGTSGRIMGTAVKADLTVTFALAKLGHLLYPGTEFCGAVRVVDIGIPADIMADADGCEFIDAGAAASLLRPRSRTGHKGSYGHSLVIAGSTGKTGAAAMAANSAVRAGSGLVTLAIPASLNHILEVKTTEAMTLPVNDAGLGFLGSDAHDGLLEAAAGRDAVALGPGISWNRDTASLVRSLATEITVPLVIDADALNAISEDTALLHVKRSACIVLTPHPGEMARLCATSTAAVEADRIGIATAFAREYGVYLVLKGARTLIASPDGRVAINGSGNPGMASGGMGDVLTGVLTAQLAQGYDPFTACRLGVFLHGHAADLVAADKGEIGISAVDVQEKLPYAFKELIAEKFH